MTYCVNYGCEFDHGHNHGYDFSISGYGYDYGFCCCWYGGSDKATHDLWDRITDTAIKIYLTFSNCILCSSCSASRYINLIR